MDRATQQQSTVGVVHPFYFTSCHAEALECLSLGHIGLSASRKPSIEKSHLANSGAWSLLYVYLSNIEQYRLEPFLKSSQRSDVICTRVSPQ